MVKMVVSAKITGYSLPREIDPNKGFHVSISLRTEGEGEDYIFGGITDEDVPGRCHGWVTRDPVPPGVTGTMEGDWPPLSEWYAEFSEGRPIPDALRWRAAVGYVDKRGSEKPEDWLVHITDQSGVVEIPVKRAVGVIEWIKAHPLEIAAMTGGVALGAMVLRKS